MAYFSEEKAVFNVVIFSNFTKKNYSSVNYDCSILIDKHGELNSIDCIFDGLNFGYDFILTSCQNFLLRENIKKRTSGNIPVSLFFSCLDKVSEEVVDLLKTVFDNERLVCVDHKDFSEIFHLKKCDIFHIAVDSTNKTEDLKNTALREALKYIGIEKSEGGLFLVEAPSLKEFQKIVENLLQYLGEINKNDYGFLVSYKKSSKLFGITSLLSYSY